MKNYIQMLEKIGQSQSIHQVDSVSEILAGVNCNEVAFKSLIKKSNDLVCVLLPDDDDE